MLLPANAFNGFTEQVGTIITGVWSDLKYPIELIIGISLGLYVLGFLINLFRGLKQEDDF